MLHLKIPLRFIIIIVLSLLITACGGKNTPAQFLHIEMHYKLLNNQPMIYGEIGSLPPYISTTHYINITAFSAKGSTRLNIQNTNGLLKNQLIVYLSDNGSYYVGQIKKINHPESIELFKPIESSIQAGYNAWDFYGNASHANSFGFKAIADFAIESLNFGESTKGNHILLGDSWFDEGSIHDRLIQKLPSASVINQGIGGNTTYDLIARFDIDVTPYAPDYVWILSGTNDYWEGLSTAQFKTNLNTLINKSKAIGAKVIIIDSSVGEGIGSTGINNHFQSEEYIKAIIELK